MMWMRELYKNALPMVVRGVQQQRNGAEAKDIYQEAVMAFYERVQQPASRSPVK